MVKPDHPPANAFVATARKVYNPVGFSKGYNFVLFFIFAGALMGFTLSRFQYLDYDGTFCGKNGQAGIGECYFSGKGTQRTGLLMHLATVLPAGFLVCFQFVPAIRHKVLLFHRINGYIILVLSVISTVGALMAARHAFGGGLETQLGVGFVGTAFVVSLFLAWVNIKRLQLEQHRAWMLRAWFYASSIITLRIIMIIMASIIGSKSEYYAVRMCAQIDYVLGKNETLATYPDCDSFYTGKDPNQQVLVKADMGDSSTDMTVGAALGLSFGPALWLAFAIHAVGIEIYSAYTPGSPAIDGWGNAINQGSEGLASPDWKLTNYFPDAHRVHITLNELGIPFEEQQIDLGVPRTEAYLKVNPRGKVPALSYNGQILVESAIVAKFLADAHPSHLVPPSNSVDGALRRARIEFFVDTYNNNVQSLVYKAIGAKTDAEADAIGRILVENIVKEIEPALADAAPYFGGSNKVTLAEALVASFVIRLRSLGNNGLLFKDAVNELSTQAPNFTKWANVLEKTPSIFDIFDESIWISKIGERITAARG
ncbi:hypothetical protein FDECE_2070 [Fusarium decemcellulare]|nr:hypothetical protein FDECE_2070 [Fusarium decemcellulare]